MKVNFIFLFLSRFRELQGGGLVVSTLADIRRGEEERREAAGVLAQVLSPWIEGNSSTEDIDSSLADIVISLKGELHSVYYSLGIMFAALWATVAAAFLPYLELLRPIKTTIQFPVFHSNCFYLA